MQHLMVIKIANTFHKTEGELTEESILIKVITTYSNKGLDEMM